MNREQVPLIARDVRRLRSDLQKAVRGFPNFHKRMIGEELRREARRVHDLVVWYWREKDRDQREEWARKLVHAIDLLKEDLQVAKQDEAFKRGFAQFEYLYVQVEAIGRQAGGILRSVEHPRGRNARGCPAGAQCAQILSTHATPAGVNQ